MVKLGQRVDEANEPVGALSQAIHDALASGVSKSEIHSMVATANPPPETNGHIPIDVPKSDEELLIFNELPPGLIDLPSAAKKYGCTVGQFRNWINRGRIKLRGRLRAPAAGGGYLVVSEPELIAYKELAATRKGRPKRSEHP